MGRARTTLLVALAAVALAMAGCGDSDDSSKNGSDDSGAPGGGGSKTAAQAPTTNVGKLKDCLAKGGAKISSEVAGVPMEAVDAADGPFTAKLPEETFTDTDDIAFLPYPRPALVQKSLEEIKSSGDGQAIVRRNVVVVLGEQTSDKAGELVQECAPGSEKRPKGKKPKGGEKPKGTKS